MTTEQQTRWTIGQTVSRADAEAMPVGTVLCADHGNGYNLTKQENGAWLSNDNGYVLPNDSLSDGYNVLVSLPSDSEVPARQFIIGQTVSREDADAMPVGTVLHAPAMGGGYNLTKRADGQWVPDNGSAAFSTSDLTPDYNTLVRLGSDSEVWTVGQVLTDNDQFNRLPVGTVIVNEEGTEYQMLAANQNRCISNGHVTTNDQRSTRTYTYTIRSLPSESEVSAPRFTVGQPLAAGEPRNLPVGAIVFQTSLPNARYERTSDGWHSLTHGGDYDTYIIGDSAAYTLESLPSRFTVGQRLTTVEDLAEVPNGTVIRANEQASSYRRVEGGYVNTASPNARLGLDLFAPSVFSIVSLPTAEGETPDEQGPVFTTGQTIAEVAQFEQLPVGAGIVHVTRPNNVYVRTATGYRMGSQTYELFAFSHGANYYRVVSLPSTFAVGQVVEGVAVRDLPLGTVVSHPETHFNYEHREDGWYSVDAQPGYANDVLVGQPHGPVTIVSLPTSDSEVAQDSGETYDQYVQRFRGSGETYLQYVQRFRVTVYGAAQANSVSVRPLNRGMELLEVPDLPMSPGMFVHYSDESANTRLPVGTVALLEADEDGDFALAGWTGSHWRVLSGCGNIVSRAMKVVSMPGVTVQDWTTQQGTPDDQRRIEEFKNSAAEFGGEAKEDNGWCGVYERTMRLMGINL